MVVWYKNRGALQYTLPKLSVISNRKRKCKTQEFYIYEGAGFDCETSKDEQSGMSFVYIWQFSLGDNVYLGREPSLFKTFLNELSELLPEGVKLIVWDANISYEWAFFREYLKEGITEVFAKTKRQILTFTYNSNIQFRECLGVFGKSLKKIAESYTKTQKLVDRYDYNKKRLPCTPLKYSELQYCINDVVILSELGKIAHDIYTLNGKKIPLTQTGIVRNAIKDNVGYMSKNKLISENKNLIRTEQEYKTLRQYLYSGGLTHSNVKYVGELLHNVRCYDLTSAYPAQLNQKYFPCGALVDGTPQEAIKHRHYILYVNFYNIKSKTSHSTISKHKCIGELVNPLLDNGRIHKAEKITLIVNEVDLYNINKIYTYDKMTCFKAMYFTSSRKCPKAIVETMNEFYKKKKQLKDCGKSDTLEYRTSKEFVNSVYGMLCTRLYTEELEWKNQELTEVTKDFEKAKNTMFNPFIGYWTTAYTRQRLIDMIAKYPDYIVQYDTDSIYCLPCKELDKEIKKINNKIKLINQGIFDGDKDFEDLGQWELEKFVSADFMALGSKRYVKRKDDKIKITFAGAIQKDLIKESERLGLDIFEFMKSFTIVADNSSKTTLKYFDNPAEVCYTDRRGVTQTVYIPSCATIEKIPFNASLSNAYDYLKNLYTGD